jgi:CDGSH-type Zn-finger protein
MHVITITPTDDGPYLVRGGAALLDADGAAYEVGETIALCRCGQSSIKPFCDGAHERARFAATERAAHAAQVR